MYKGGNTCKGQYKFNKNTLIYPKLITKRGTHTYTKTDVLKCPLKKTLPRSPLPSKGMKNFGKILQTLAWGHNRPLATRTKT
jgi:hypothetical protein